MSDPSLTALLASIRKHLDVLAVTALSDPEAELERELEEEASHV